MLPENGEELQDKVVKPHSFEKVSQDKLESPNLILVIYKENAPQRHIGLI